VAADDGTTYQRTLRGRFVPSGRLAPAKPSAFESRLVDAAHPLPRAFMAASGVKSLLARGASAALKTGETVARLAEFPFLGEERRGDKLIAAIGPGVFLPRRTVAVAAPVPAPAGLKPKERWIDVNLTEQTLVAYEGAMPVFATVVSSGRPGFETPEGSFSIYAKHVTVTMDDTAAGAEAYSIEDVPWTMFFKDSIALHAAFWHDKFGRVHSHGCVNLAPADARRLFFWAGPTLPAGLHGIVATRQNPGTRVIVHK
ncbi:MAG: L,D-transpeptidase, partial [Deltaproteobacteria bacterium]|nr:L,D-transpeptidase [Deltaproteobacteria bacterium]